MTYQELVKKVQTALKKADASAVAEHIAAQVNVTGEAEGAFYIEINEGKFVVEPYDYNDRDFLLTADEAEILAVAQGKKTLEAAVTEGTVAHEGDWDKTLLLSNAIPAAKKTTRKTKAKEETAPAVEAEAPKTEETAPVAEAETPKAEEQLTLTEEAPKEEAPAKTKTAAKSKTASKTKSASTTKKTTKKTKK